jgi:hypothetical protein
VELSVDHHFQSAHERARILKVWWKYITACACEWGVGRAQPVPGPDAPPARNDCGSGGRRAPYHATPSVCACDWAERTAARAHPRRGAL